MAQWEGVEYWGGEHVTANDIGAFMLFSNTEGRPRACPKMHVPTGRLSLSGLEKWDALKKERFWL